MKRSKKNIKNKEDLSMYKGASKIAYRAHYGQFRRGGTISYIIHPLRVANSFKDDIKKTIAILHDVAEDTELGLEDLKQFGVKVVDAVDALSRRKEEKYFDYIKRLKKNELAVEIKIVDIIDNISDTTSVQSPSMIKRYDKSLKMLLA